MFQSLGSSANSTKIKMYTLQLAVDWWTCYMLVNLNQRTQLFHHGLSCTTYRYFRCAVLSKLKKKNHMPNRCTGYTMLFAIQPTLHGFLWRVNTNAVVLFDSFYCVQRPLIMRQNSYKINISNWTQLQTIYLLQSRKVHTAHLQEQLAIIIHAVQINWNI